jgi:sarcosine oxidase subunit alpha
VSPGLARSFALALLEDGRARIGKTVFTVGLHGAQAARVVEPVFYDKEGARLDA